MIRAAAHRPAVVWATCAVLLLAGAVAFTRLPLATKTSVELPRLSVVSAWPGSSPEVMETFVTSPIESAILGVRGVKSISSSSRDGSASLTIELEPRTDVQMARLAILERLELLRRDLPAGVTQPYVSNWVPEGLEESPLMELVVTGPYTAGALQKNLAERVKPRLSGVPGVASVNARGGAELGVSIRYDPGKLTRLNISPDLLSAALADARIAESVGEIERGTFVQRVVLHDQPAAIDSLGALPIMAPGGRRFRLDELADVRAEEDTRNAFYRINGEPAVSLEVSRHPGADAIRTAAQLREVVAQVQRTLPPMMQIKLASDSSEDLRIELRNLAIRGAIAFFAVMLVLAVLLRRWQSVALVMGTTAVAISATALTLFIADIPANLLTLAGLGMGVGILVQNAIVVVDRLALVRGDADTRAAATSAIAPAIYGSTLTTAVVLLPFLYLQGDARAAFVPFALAFVISLGWSVATALLIIPALAPSYSAVTPEVEWPKLRRAYLAIVRKSLRWRWATLFVSVVVLVGLGWVFVKKIPRYSWGSYGMQRTTLQVSLSFPRGSDPATLDNSMKEFERIVVGRPEVEQVRTTSGGSGSAFMQVTFTRDGGFTQVPLQMQEELVQRAILIGGASVGVYGQGPAFSNGGGGGGFSNYSIEVRGFSYDGAMRLASDIKTRLEAIPRVRDAVISAGGNSFYYEGGGPGYQVVLEPERAMLARYGITSSQFAAGVARAVRGAVGGKRIEIDGEEMPVTIKASGASEANLDKLKDALLPSSTGAPVRLSDVASIETRSAHRSIERIDQEYVLNVRYDFRGPAKLAERTHKAFVASLTAPAGYKITDLNARGFNFGDDSAKGLWVVFALGLVLVILSVAIVFDSVWGSAMVLMSLPLALAGVVVAFSVTGAAFTREAAVGVILVVGLAVNQCILLVDSVLARRQRDRRVPVLAMLRGCRDRAPMIVLITFAALASLIPLSVGTKADTLFGAIALATAGGTVAGTLGVLFIMPSLITGRARRSKNATRRRRKRWSFKFWRKS